MRPSTIMDSIGTLRRHMVVSDLLFQSVHANDVLVSRWTQLEKCNRIFRLYYETPVNLYTGIAVEQKLQHDEKKCRGVEGAFKGAKCNYDHSLKEKLVVS